MAMLERRENFWVVRPVKAGTTTLTICYDYEAIDSDEPISGNSCETVNLTVSKYKALLNLDSYYSTILPGESVQFSAKLQEAVKNEYGQYDFRDVENATFELIEGESYEKVMNEPVSTETNKWTVSSIVDGSKPGGIEFTSGTEYKVKAKVDNEVVAQSDETTIYVSSKFYEVHNKGDFAVNIRPYSTRNLLQGEEINAICTGENAEYEIWKKYYDNEIKVENVSNSESIKQLAFYYGGQEPFNMIYDDDGYCHKIIAEDNHALIEIPWDGYVNAHVKILEDGEEHSYVNPVPVKVMGYDMKFEGLDLGEHHERYGNRVGVFLNSDRVEQAEPEVNVKATLDCDEETVPSSSYQMQYTIGYVSEETDWEFAKIECEGISAVTTGNENGYLNLGSEDLHTLFNTYKGASNDYCELIVKVKALKKNQGESLGPAYYSSDEFNIIINETTDTDFYFDNTVMPGEYIEIEKHVTDRRFVNEFVPDGGYVDYIVSEKPIVTADEQDWYEIKESDDKQSWRIEISKDAQSSCGKSATVSFNYVLSNGEDTEAVKRKYEFSFNVVSEFLRIYNKRSSVSLHLLFSQSTVLEPEVRYEYYDDDEKEIRTKLLSKGELDDVNVSVEKTETSCYNPEGIPEEYGGGFTKSERDAGKNKWTITAISPDECNYPAIGGGYDNYRITAVKGTGDNKLTQNLDVQAWVSDERYVVEYKGGEPLKINVNGSEEERKIKLSDFALYKYYIKGEYIDGSWIGKMLDDSQLSFNTQYMNTYFFSQTADHFIIVNDDIGKGNLPEYSTIYFNWSRGILEFEAEINDGSSNPEDKDDDKPNNPGGNPSAEEEKKPEEEKKTEDIVNVDVPTSSMTELNGEVSVTIDSKSVIDSIGQGTKEVTINAKSNAQDIVASHVTVPSEIIKSIANAEASLELKTSLGNIKLDKESIDVINKKADIKSITFNTEKLKSGSTYTNYDVTILVNGTKKISRFGNGKLNITFDVPQKVDLNKGAKVLYKDGQYFYDMLGKVDTANKTITFETNHLSTYLVAGTLISHKRLVGSVKKSKTKALKLSPKKGKMIVSWKKGAGNQPTSYIVYRSLKKNSGFKKVANVRNGKMSCVDKKSLKKGKKYYYKVQGMLKVDGEKTYTKFTPVRSIKAK